MPVESVYSWLQSETNSRMELSGMIVGRWDRKGFPTLSRFPPAQVNLRWCYWDEGYISKLATWQCDIRMKIRFGNGDHPAYAECRKTCCHRRGSGHRLGGGGGWSEMWCIHSVLKSARARPPCDRYFQPTERALKIWVLWHPLCLNTEKQKKEICYKTI